MPLHITTARRISALACAAVLGLTITSCGDSTTNSEDPSSRQTASNGDLFNKADVAFATQMIPHHAQAVEMVTLTRGRPLDPAVHQLAMDIRDAQVPEVETMTDWLTAWGADIPETSIDHVNGGHDMEGMSDAERGMPGMMTNEEMTTLKQASDAEFQQMWLEMMIKHHAGAIDMAHTEEDDGTFSGAVALAASIATSQQAEIDSMEKLLDP